MKFTARDKNFMKRTIELACLGELAVSPNPMVGAVIAKGGKIIAEGWHKKFGGPHAEINALREAGISAANATLYVNLEPCSHCNKKTPPCVPEIIASGISRVVVGMKDPNPEVNGRGILDLKRAGIKVDVGCLKNDALQLNAKFAKWIATKIPYVGMKVAMSLDGKIATKSGESKWITSPESRNFVHNLRDTYDAVLVGINTVIADDPMLKGKIKEPARIILDSKLRIPLRANVLRDSNVIIATTAAAEKSKLNRLKKRGVILKIFPSRIELTPLLHFLGKRGISSILVEGGSEVFGSFTDKRLVDHFYWFVALKVIGGRGAMTAVSGKGIEHLKQSLALFDVVIKKIGDDILIEADA